MEFWPNRVFIELSFRSRVLNRTDFSPKTSLNCGFQTFSGVDDIWLLLSTSFRHPREEEEVYAMASYLHVSGKLT